MTPAEFLPRMVAAAVAAGHIFPEMAACEAALESAWGESWLAREANNFFGMKQHQHHVFESITLPTHEVVAGKTIAEPAEFVKYPDVASCFADRMATLRRLECYKAALVAADAVQFVVFVSRRWSTDPDRGAKVIAIYHRHFPEL